MCDFRRPCYEWPQFLCVSCSSHVCLLRCSSSQGLAQVLCQVHSEHVISPLFQCLLSFCWICQIFFWLISFVWTKTNCNNYVPAAAAWRCQWGSLRLLELIKMVSFCLQLLLFWFNNSPSPRPPPVPSSPLCHFHSRCLPSGWSNIHQP